MAKKISMSDKAKKAVEAASEDFNIVLDFSPGSAASLEEVISMAEQIAREALDLDAEARVADEVEGTLDLEALGAYYGELFVRHAGAMWGKADGENGPEPAVICGEITVLPLDIVRRRVFDGQDVDLVGIFKANQATMARGQKTKKGKSG
jgi:hypothetical protein